MEALNWVDEEGREVSLPLFDRSRLIQSQRVWESTSRKTRKGSGIDGSFPSPVAVLSSFGRNEQL